LNCGPTDVQLTLGLTDARREQLEIYVGMLLKWQSAINLIGAETAADVWRRHILDSGQLYAHVKTIMETVNARPGTIADLGSGAGFPGIVLSIMGLTNIDLIESDSRKATFLGEVIRTLNLNAQVLNVRAETLPHNECSIITARAFAPLPRLLNISYPLLKTGGKLLILKGKTVDEELTQCQKQWNMTAIKQPSISDASGAVLLIQDIEPIHA